MTEHQDCWTIARCSEPECGGWAASHFSDAVGGMWHMAHDYSTVLAEVKGELECCNLNWERALEELKLQDGELTRLRTVTDEMAIALRELMSAARPYLEPGGYPYGNPAIARARAALEAALEVHPAGEPDRREEN